jgi:hypothetical protein
MTQTQSTNPTITILKFFINSSLSTTFRGGECRTKYFRSKLGEFSERVKEPCQSSIGPNVAAQKEASEERQAREKAKIDEKIK